ncbi:hypothetical protein, partial [Sulfurovum sp.]|uniref:hypothetical protein n=1 Tax=Sulfurovum sp. TaxID=1969726 RepID=UPI0025FAC8DA
MKKILLTLLAIGTMMTYAQAEMKCAPGKCAAGKCGKSMNTGNKPKKMMKMFQAVPKGKATLLQ